ncbi:hypothetical protein ACX1N5_15540 [Acinetobacter sp. ANC 4636]
MNFKNLFTTLFFVPTIASANTCHTKSDALIKDLYKTFPVDGSNTTQDASPALLNQFFSKKLSNLIIKDEKCAEKIQGLCNIEFNILTAAQDDPDQNKYKILQSAKTLVTVRLEYDHIPKFLNFKISSNSRCLLIEDIEYVDDQLSLLEILNRKVP